MVHHYFLIRIAIEGCNRNIFRRIVPICYLLMLFFDWLWLNWNVMCFRFHRYPKQRDVCFFCMFDQSAFVYLEKGTFLRLFMLTGMLEYWWCWWCLLTMVMILMMSTTPSHGGYSACVCGLKWVVWLKNVFCELVWNSSVATLNGQAGWIVMPGRSQWWSGHQTSSIPLLETCHPKIYLESRSCLLFQGPFLWHFAILKSAVNIRKVPWIPVEILFPKWYTFQWPKFRAFWKVPKTMRTRLSRYRIYPESLSTIPNSIPTI